jgi:hypothetical protein
VRSRPDKFEFGGVGKGKNDRSTYQYPTRDRTVRILQDGVIPAVQARIGLNKCGVHVEARGVADAEGDILPSQPRSVHIPLGIPLLWNFHPANWERLS